MINMQLINVESWENGKYSDDYIYHVDIEHTTPIIALCKKIKNVIFHAPVSFVFDKNIVNQLNITGSKVAIHLSPNDDINPSIIPIEKGILYYEEGNLNDIVKSYDKYKEITEYSRYYPMGVFIKSIENSEICTLCNNVHEHRKQKGKNSVELQMFLWYADRAAIVWQDGYIIDRKNMVYDLNTPNYVYYMGNKIEINNIDSIIPSLFLEKCTNCPINTICKKSGITDCKKTIMYYTPIITYLLRTVM